MLQTTRLLPRSDSLFQFSIFDLQLLLCNNSVMWMRAKIHEVLEERQRGRKRFRFECWTWLLWLTRRKALFFSKRSAILVWYAMFRKDVGILYKIQTNILHEENCHYAHNFKIWSKKQLFVKLVIWKTITI